MGFAQKYIPHYTYNDWIHWEGRWELIEGIPIATSPMPLPEHQKVAAELRTEFTLALRKSRCKTYKAYDPLDYKITDDTILVPDELIVCGNINKSYLDFPPALVIEVLSKATEERDRGIKYELYEQEGVKYYHSRYKEKRHRYIRVDRPQIPVGALYKRFHFYIKREL